MRKVDRENRWADSEMERWARQDEENQNLARDENGYGPEGMTRRWEKEKEKELSQKRRVLRENNNNSIKNKNPEKKKTGEEVRKMIVEKEQLRAVKRAKREAVKMVKKGKMMSIDRYFK